jgi:hypothetical protein
MILVLRYGISRNLPPPPIPGIIVSLKQSNFPSKIGKAKPAEATDTKASPLPPKSPSSAQRNVKGNYDSPSSKYHSSNNKNSPGM